jgi:hypothetical protein
LESSRHILGWCGKVLNHAGTVFSREMEI